MDKITELADLHRQLTCITAPTRIRQTISDHRLGCGANNQPANALEFKTYVSLADLYGTEKYDAFKQGFYCIAIHLRAEWGGWNYDGSTLIGVKLSAHVLDRLAGGMAKKTWTTDPLGEIDTQIELTGIVQLVLALLVDKP